jgi:ABC-type amino acid transport substrate-binding protein
MTHSRAAIACAFATALLGISIACSTSQGTATQPAYERVLRTKTIRAAYVSYPPGTIIIDKAARRLSGICVDTLDEIGKQLDLTIQYTEEVGWLTMIEGLNSGRYETVAAPVWANPTRSKQALFSKPLFYSVVGVWIRADDRRFTQENFRESINSPSVRIGSLDGSTMIGIARSDFPRAELVTFPELTGEPQVFLELQQHRIDVFMTEPATAYYHLKSHPGSIKNVAETAPVRAFPVIFLLPRNEPQLKNMFDATIETLHNSGVLGRTIKQYQPVPGAFGLVPQPFLMQPN